MTVERYHVDQYGNCLGYFDTVGHYFDPTGQYRGSLSQDGHLCDQYGTALGRVDTQRQVWNEDGSYRGYLVDARGHDGPRVLDPRLAALMGLPGAAESKVSNEVSLTSLRSANRRHGQTLKAVRRPKRDRAVGGANGNHRQQRLAEMGAALAQIVHDLGNPLSGMALQAQVILRHLENESAVPAAAIRQPTAQILSTLHRLDGYVKALLDFAREHELRLRPLPLGPFLQDVAKSWQPAATAQAISLGAHVEDAGCVLADATQLRRVFDNLIKNAIEAIGNGPGDVLLTATAGAGAIEIAVEDTGPGAADPRQLFRPFRTTKCAGTGLGLAVAKQIVDAHGGRINYVQRRPHGAVFRISLRRHTPLDTLRRYEIAGYDEA